MKNLFVFTLVSFLFPLGLMAQKSSGAQDYTTAVLWEQHSGEYRALAFQAYNFARLSLLEQLKTADSSKPNCVVVDIDETVLDNSPFQGTEINKGQSYNAADWAKWTSMGVADTVPGALGFLKFAASNNVEVFYITNRETSEHDGTLQNLQKHGFPYADEAHLVLKSGTSDKEPRRLVVREKYNILLLCGDNLSDFSNVFYRENKNTKEQVDLHQKWFGTKYIVLPNPMYGDWEKPLYKGKDLKEADRSRQRQEALKTY
ncbi:5'-nucleotidase, lipoprotein e(P4) family [Pedobacter nutrimenti]|jgi:5'-nucleotidase (lipoprotein e(P4) family)|uniref:5'-nucleotidase (Lipoprotein e(P4) family) n=1 Tax=Pedobacter nutrimenti TaxID=1241337 RepID=A0A318U872_9SPHI|nr:5'-nucleotidase, lipoprotein e(P4) family [Pedobacter nutrimenti]PYF70655.1 5'-nucleotidase (lipoprotein e(P4) family) [Pedobacter nutrimenti]